MAKVLHCCCRTTIRCSLLPEEAYVTMQHLKINKNRKKDKGRILLDLAVQPKLMLDKMHRLYSQRAKEGDERLRKTEMMYLGPFIASQGH